MNESAITQEMVHSRFIYVHELGRLVWLRRPRGDFESANTWSVWNSRYAGNVAGSIGTIGYRSINVFGKMRKASRLTWVYHFGDWPEIIDHIDGDTTNDAVENLRNVGQAQNCQNRALGSNNKTGHYGVYVAGDVFRAQINANGRRVYLGTFPTIEAAVLARQAAERKFGFHENHGRAA